MNYHERDYGHSHKITANLEIFMNILYIFVRK